MYVHWIKEQTSGEEKKTGENQDKEKLNWIFMGYIYSSWFDFVIGLTLIWHTHTHTNTSDVIALNLLWLKAMYIFYIESEQKNLSTKLLCVINSLHSLSRMSSLKEKTWMNIDCNETANRFTIIHFKWWTSANHFLPIIFLFCFRLAFPYTIDSIQKKKFSSWVEKRRWAKQNEYKKKTKNNTDSERNQSWFW